MPKFFTHYWKKTTFLENTKDRESFIPFNHTAGNEFGDRGIVPGDIVYGISFFSDTLYIIGRLQVDRVASTEEASEFIGYPAWEAEFHLLSKQGNHTLATNLTCLTGDNLDRIEFILHGGSRSGVAYNEKGRIDPQTFRGTRSITRETAVIFDEYLAKWEIEAEKSSAPTEDAYFTDIELRKEVEAAAVEIAKEWLSEDGYTITDRQLENCGYDLHCEKDDFVLHVEVKGTTSSAISFIMTRNEHDVAKVDPNYLLFVVTNALGDFDVKYFEQEEIFRNLKLEVISYKARFSQVSG